VLVPGESLTLDDYTMRYDGYRLEAIDDHFGAINEITLFHGGKEVGRIESEQRMHPNLVFPQLRNAFLRAKASHGQEQHARDVVGLYGLVQQLERGAGREVKVPSTEVGLYASLSPLALSRLGEDFYVTPLGIDPETGATNFRVFVNPMVEFIWLGGLIFVLGAHLCVLPDRRERMRLKAAIEVEEQERAVA